MTEEIKEYLKHNLSIEIKDLGDRIEVGITLEGNRIAYDYFDRER